MSEQAGLMARDPFQLLDAEDERALTAELAGQVVETYVYEVEVWDPRKRQKVKAHQLSKSGVDAVCRATSDKGEMIRELEMEHVVDHDRREVFFRVKAGRFKRNPDGSETLLDTAFGIKRQPMDVRKRDGTTMENPHWYEHGGMKAARNARRRLIPERLAMELIRKWSQDAGRVQRIEQDDAPERPAPPPKARQEAAPSGDESDRSAALAYIAGELTNAFGDGDPEASPEKKEVLRRVFRVGDWASLKRMPLGTFLERYSKQYLNDTIEYVRRGE